MNQFYNVPYSYLSLQSLSLHVVPLCSAISACCCHLEFPSHSLQCLHTLSVFVVNFETQDMDYNPHWKLWTQIVNSWMCWKSIQLLTNQIYIECRNIGMHLWINVHTLNLLADTLHLNKIIILLARPRLWFRPCFKPWWKQSWCPVATTRSHMG